MLPVRIQLRQQKGSLAPLMKMNSLKQHPIQFLFNPSKPITIYYRFQQSSYASSFSAFPSSETPKPTNSNLTLTHEELTKINLLLPRLCLSGHLTTAIHLTTTSLLTNPPPKSLSLSILVHSLTSQPDMAKPMSLLTILRHTPPTYPHITSITTMLITSYIKKKRPKEALKVYHWMLRPGFPCKMETIVYGILVNGLCMLGLVLEALKVLRDMVDVGFVPGNRLRKRVYRSLLREARVREAMELDKVLCGCFEDGNGEAIKKVIGLLDSMIGNWTE